MSELDFRPKMSGFVSPFGQAVEKMRVTATTRNEQVFGEVQGWYTVKISIAPGYAERVGEQRLEQDLSRVARLLFAARSQEYYRLMAVHLNSDPLAARRSREQIGEAFENRSASAASRDGAAEVFTVGLRQFTVSIARGSAESLGSEALGRSCTEAANALVDAWLDVVAEYKKERWEARQ